MPGVVGQLHLHQHIAGEELALGVDLHAATDLDDILGRHQDLFKQAFHALADSLFADRLGDLLLEARIDVDDVPVARHGAVSDEGQAPRPRINRTPQAIT